MKTKYKITNTEEFVKKASEVHDNKYSYEKSIYTGMTRKILIICKDHGEWWQLTSSHLRGYGCKKCGTKINGDNRRLNNYTVDSFLIKNNKNFIRKSEYECSDGKIKFQCLECNYEWETTFSIIQSSKNYNCRKCYIKSKTFSNEYIDAILINKKIYIKRLDLYINASTKIKWFCLKCKNIWMARPNEILNMRAGCPPCGHRKYNNDDIDHILFKENRNIKRIGDHTITNKHIKWECEKCNHQWMAKSSSIITGKNTGCPKCSKFLKNQYIVENTILKLNIQIQKITIKLLNKTLYPDFYLPEYNLIIEYQGAQHYIPIKFGNYSQEIANKNFKNQQIRDQLMRDYCKENNISLLEIDGRKYKGNKLIRYTREHFNNIDKIL